ncbi:Uncharacterised protein [Vibrio cholerae]|nr:Uncharacterised protein [Vibrio cholerae]
MQKLLRKSHTLLSLVATEPLTSIQYFEHSTPIKRSRHKC